MIHARRDRFIAHGLALAALVAVPARAYAEDTPAAPGPSEQAAPPPSAPPAAPAPPPEPLPSHASPTLSYALLGAGGVSFVVGAVFGVLALSDKSSFDSNPSYDKSDAVRSKTLVADVGLGLGVILAGTGVAFLLVNNSGSSASAPQPQPRGVAQVSVAPMVGPSRGGAMLNVSFQ